jgi:hypothetical protein
MSTTGWILIAIACAVFVLVLIVVWRAGSAGEEKAQSTPPDRRLSRSARTLES